ncbi:hypothetical protein GCM10009661_62200 [Catellatospora chokoriensis]|uniref:Uncharacterized protein n=1 Tax=Catellatospora chokoriensis TaxID=310353 RepID=A0A8J3JSK9_9ACTN|nr:hypothetical protein Cch02nite_37650 [Catellatospora chokoriensis]
MLDYGVIQPRLQRLYDWSARELDLPGLRGLVHHLDPVYVCPFADRHVWVPPDGALPRLLRRLTNPRT